MQQDFCHKRKLRRNKVPCGLCRKVRGVDSVDDGEGAAEACISLAKRYDTVVAATGRTDIITDGERTCLIENGTTMLTLVTGAGCMARGACRRGCGSMR